ncbi:MAG: hypothetical protein V1673_05175 [Candidatus Omnitrophota bacterium]
MRKISFGFALLFLLQLGASAPQISVDSKRSVPVPKGSKPQSSLSSVATPQAVGDQIAQFFRRKTGKELMMEKSRNAAGARTATKQVLAGKPSVRTVKAVPVKPGYVPPPPTPRASVSQVRQEIQKILDLNKKIKNLQSGRAIQFQRVQEQARIHQKILNELEASQKQAAGQKASAKNALLAQEKLRIIHEETQRNARAIDDLKEMPAGTVPIPINRSKAEIGAVQVTPAEKKIKTRAVSKTVGKVDKVKPVAS